MGLLDKIKQDAQRSGQNKSKFIYFREGEKKRIRFLNDMEDGFELTFHDSFDAGINVPCQEIFGRNCQYCEEEGIRTRTQYAWSVYDYDANEVKVFMFPMNNCSPLGAIAAMYETYGTLLDRDYVVSVTGKQQNKTFSVVPMDKNKFRNEKAKPYSKSAFLKILDKAFPDEHKDYSKDEDEEKDLNEMSAKELYQYCEDHDIEAEPKMKKDYYLNLIEEAKESEDDSWDDDEEKSKYSAMSPKELYKLCQERNIDAEPRKISSYYINLLEEADKAEDDWEDEDSEEEDDDWDD